MNWMTDYRETANERAAATLRAPIGLMSPFWLAYGAAVGAGATWWWMNRLARAANLEAMHGVASGVAAAQTAVAAVSLETPAEAAPALEAVEAVIESAVEEAEVEADDLTRLVGIGPRIAEALAERGVATFAQLAAWTEDEVGEFDAALNLKGRARRDAWVAQARRLADA